MSGLKKNISSMTKLGQSNKKKDAKDKNSFSKLSLNQLIPWENDMVQRQSPRVVHSSSGLRDSGTSESNPVYSLESRSEDYLPIVLISEEDG